LTRARILDSAAHVLSSKGYAGLRLTDVAASAELQADGSGAPLDREKLLRACQAGNLAPPDAVIPRLIW